MVSSNEVALVSTRDSDAAADLLLNMLVPTVSAGLLHWMLDQTTVWQ